MVTWGTVRPGVRRAVRPSPPMIKGQSGSLFLLQGGAWRRGERGKYEGKWEREGKKEKTGMKGRERCMVEVTTATHFNTHPSGLCLYKP